MRIVAVSPHRDDAAFSLGLSLAHWMGAGHKVRVLNCFTESAYAPYSDAESLHNNDRTSFVSAVRRREDVAWNKLLGGKLEFTDLEMLDAPLRLACSVHEAMSAEVRAGDRAVARVAGAVAKLLRSDAAADLAILLPLAIGGHIDHRVTRQAGLEALAGSTLPVAFYEDLPYAARSGAEAFLEGAVESTGMGLEAAFAEAPHANAELQCARKQRMAECYDSQIDSEEAEQVAGFCRNYAGRERMWANEAFRASVLCVPAGVAV